jgi:hypothetical protein
MIKVERKRKNEFLVVVAEAVSSTKHSVTLDEDYYQKLTRGEISKEDLIKRSFNFLLAREPKESILQKFNLRLIKRYFPSYENEINI